MERCAGAGAGALEERLIRPVLFEAQDLDELFEDAAGDVEDLAFPEP